MHYHGAAQQPAMALQLADRVVEDNLTLETIRTLVRGSVRPEQRVRQEEQDVNRAQQRRHATEQKDFTRCELKFLCEQPVRAGCQKYANK